MPSVLWHCWKSIRPVKTEWCGYLSEATVCIRSSWCHCHPQTPSSPASFKSRLVLPFWYQLTRVVPDKGPLNGCVCVCYHTPVFVRHCIETFKLCKDFCIPSAWAENTVMCGRCKLSWPPSQRPCARSPDPYPNITGTPWYWYPYRNITGTHWYWYPYPNITGTHWYSNVTADQHSLSYTHTTV